LKLIVPQGKFIEIKMFELFGLKSEFINSKN